MSFFERLFGRDEREKAYIEALRTLVESNIKTADMVMTAVNKITETQSKQIEAINTHLGLFKMAEAPSATTMTGAAENKAWAEQNGFPFEGTPEEIARWIETHDTDE